MKRMQFFVQVLAFIASGNLFALANEPIQRIDVVNTLGTPGSVTPTPVSIAVSNGGSAPCFTTTLHFHKATTILVGVGNPCITPVNSISVTPLTSEGGQGVMYNTPSFPTTINGTLYSSQITISESSSPAFDPTNGGLISLGNLQTIVVGHFR